MAHTADAADAVMLLGPTASGKSALAMQLAQTISLEIVSVDSAQVYRGMDVGTAKPSAVDRQRVPHHLIDIRDPSEPYSAADFVRDAAVAISEIRGRGRMALLVGGTMLYAKALREGLSDLPSADPEIRSQIEDEAAQRGWPAMHAKLARTDPMTAARLKPNDSQRIQRALEIYETTGGTRMSELLVAERKPPLKITAVALLPADRAQLHERIALRFNAMLDAGLLDEVRTLRARGDLHPDLPSMRSVGYRQAWRHLAGEWSFDQMRQAGIAATRQLAKRQITWLRSMPNVTVIEPTAHAALKAISTVTWSTERGTSAAAG